MSDISVSLQLYTVRDQTAQHFEETIRQVAALGYTGVEFAGYGDLPAPELAALLRETALQVAGTHISLEKAEHNLDGEIDYCIAIGCQSLIVPWLSPELCTAAGIHAVAQRLNALGRHCYERGIAFGFHNHALEFTEAEGKYLLDILLDETDPAFVQSELDTYWAAYAGVDPRVYMAQRTGRIRWVHLKDMTPERTFAEVGDGTLDINGIIDAARLAGAQWYIVENDAPTIPSLESARRSIENLLSLRA